MPGIQLDVAEFKPRGAVLNRYEALATARLETFAVVMQRAITPDQANVIPDFIPKERLENKAASELVGVITREKATNLDEKATAIASVLYLAREQRRDFLGAIVPSLAFDPAEEFPDMVERTAFHLSIEPFTDVRKDVRKSYRDTLRNDVVDAVELMSVADVSELGTITTPDPEAAQPWPGLLQASFAPIYAGMALVASAVNTARRLG